MTSREQNINHAYKARGECCRKGCRLKAISRIFFFNYSDYNDRRTTFACLEHARWWVKGQYGAPLGRQVTI